MRSIPRKKGWERIRVQVDSGAIDHVMPKDVAKGFEIRPTTASTKGQGYSAANGTIIRNHGEKRLVGRTEKGELISMAMQCADVTRVLGSVHRMNQGGSVVVFDGKDSFAVHKKTGKVTNIHEENGQFVFYVYVQSNQKEQEIGSATAKPVRSVEVSNRFGELAGSDEEEEYQDFAWQDCRF